MSRNGLGQPDWRVYREIPAFCYFLGLFLCSQALDEIPNLLILCLYLGNRVSPPACKLAGRGVRTGGRIWGKNTFECLWFMSPVASTFTQMRNYLIKDVNNNIYSHVIRTSTISLKMSLCSCILTGRKSNFRVTLNTCWMGDFSVEEGGTAHQSSIRPAEWLTRVSENSTGDKICKYLNSCMTRLTRRED